MTAYNIPKGPVSDERLAPLLRSCADPNFYSDFEYFTASEELVQQATSLLERTPKFDQTGGINTQYREAIDILKALEARSRTVSRVALEEILSVPQKRAEPITPTRKAAPPLNPDLLHNVLNYIENELPAQARYVLVLVKNEDHQQALCEISSLYCNVLTTTTKFDVEKTKFYQSASYFLKQQTPEKDPERTRSHKALRYVLETLIEQAKKKTQHLRP